MRRSVLSLVAVAVLALAGLPASAGPDDKYDPVDLTTNAPQRFIAKAPGTTEDLKMLFGPYVIPPGQDANRITADLQVPTGHLLAVAPDLIDATGQVMLEQQAHIHHAHWFRVDADAPADGATPSGLSWVFGTGEEKTQGRLDDRARAESPNLLYGIPVGGPQSLIYMIHNKTPKPLTVFVVLRATFLHGSAADASAATGKDVRPVLGTLWGETKDATSAYPTLKRQWTATGDGVAIAMGSHAHPGGYGVDVVNLGPGGKCAGADADGDGLPGVTLLHSKKYDRVQATWPYSEDYQMGVTKFGWRAPIHKGDVLAQHAPYDVDDPSTPGVIETIDGVAHNWYEAMAFTGIYIDYSAAPASGADDCTLSAFAPTLLNGADTFEAQGMSIAFPDGDVRIDDLRGRYEAGVTMGMVNHLWQGDADPVCFGAGCTSNGATWQPGPGIETDTVHVAGFLYGPGDLTLPNLAGAPARVKRGSKVTFLNEDVAANIRHTVTSCEKPCTGTYVANYPLPSAAFDSGKIGNLDPVDDGADLENPRTYPQWVLDTTSLEPGVYPYFCRIHPWMRGAIEVYA